MDRLKVTKMENLPADILSDILIWLPARSFVQMRCVSKPWNAILSQPSFIKSHIDLHRSLIQNNNNNNNNNDESYLVVSLGRYGKPFSLTPAPFSQLPPPKSIKLPMDIPIHIPHHDINFIGSVNGLICICFPLSLYKDIVIKIWNPFLSAVSTLPPCRLPGRMHLRFGFDPKTDDYKLVKLMHLHEPSRRTLHLERDDFVIKEKRLVKVEVYSMKKGFWKLINNESCRFPMHISEVSDKDKVCVDGHDGHLHWLGYTCINGVKELKTIVVFDLGLETFSEISLPHSHSYSCYVVDEHHSYNLGVLDGKLCVIIMSWRKGYEIWVMKKNEYESSWVKHSYSDTGIGIIKGVIPFGFTLTNKCVCAFFHDLCLNLYDQIAGKSKSFCVLGWDYVIILQYVETLDWIYN